MAGTFAAFVLRYNSLTNVPTAFDYDVPPADGSTQILPPYSVIENDGTTPRYDFEHTVVEDSNFAIVVYANTQEALDAYVEQIKYNGGATTAGLGMDFGPLPDLTIPYSDLVVTRTSERSFLVKQTGAYAQRVYGCELRYQVTVFRT